MQIFQALSLGNQCVPTLPALHPRVHQQPESSTQCPEFLLGSHYMGLFDQIASHVL